MLKAGINQRVRVSKHMARRAPLEFTEAAAKWARANGGDAKIVWYPEPMNVWAVILKYKVGDPRSGSEEDGEPILLHDWWTKEEWAERKPHMARRDARNNIRAGAYPYDLHELGVEGMLEFLNKTNILSGRGEYDSAQAAVDHQKEAHETRRERLRLSKQSDAKHRARDLRRSLFKIPFLSVGIELSKEKAAS